MFLWLKTAVAVVICDDGCIVMGVMCDDVMGCLKLLPGGDGTAFVRRPVVRVGWSRSGHLSAHRRSLARSFTIHRHHSQLAPFVVVRLYSYSRLCRKKSREQRRAGGRKSGAESTEREAGQPSRQQTTKCTLHVSSFFIVGLILNKTAAAAISETRSHTYRRRRSPSIVMSNDRPTRQTRASRRQQTQAVLDDFDDAAAADQQMDETTATTKDEGDVMKSRIMDRLKKTGDRTKQSAEKRRSTQPIKEEVVPPAVSAIPKKSSAAASSSLLSGMSVPPSSTTVATPKASKSPAAPPSGTQDAAAKGPTSSTTALSASSSSKVTSNSSPREPELLPVAIKSKTVLQDRVWQALAELCTKMDANDNRAFRLGPAAVGPTVDLSLSFLRTEREYDWFDLDPDGNIVLQPKVPIFPEDFPPGMPEWPLSWWGIVDPAVGERKNPKVVTASGEEVMATSAVVAPSSRHSPLPPDSDKQREEGRKRSRSREQRDREHGTNRSSKRRSSSSGRSRDRKRGAVVAEYDSSRAHPRERRRNDRSPDSLERYPARPHDGPPPPLEYLGGGRGGDPYMGAPPPRDDRPPYAEGRGPPPPRRMDDRRFGPGGDRGGPGDRGPRYPPDDMGGPPPPRGGGGGTGMPRGGEDRPTGRFPGPFREDRGGRYNGNFPDERRGPPRRSGEEPLPRRDDRNRDRPRFPPDDRRGGRRPDDH
jgi:hypothetical protein